MTSDSRLAQDPFRPRSRAFLFGESVFTTLRVENGVVYFAERHLQRLKESAEWLWPGTVGQIDELWSNLKPPGKNGVWRLTLFAMQIDRKMRVEEIPHLEIDSSWSEGLPQAGSFLAKTVKAPARAKDWPPFLKSGDYLSRLVAARHLAKNEIPLYLVNDEVCEFLHANLFLWIDNQLYTPPTGPDVLAGLGRERLMEVATQLGIPCVEKVLLLNDIKAAQSVWAINAVRGIVEVEAIDAKKVEGHALKDSLQRNFFSRS
ncbi:MAG: aminotransferase class IV [Bacteriovoracia bacterium]